MNTTTHRRRSRSARPRLNAGITGFLPLVALLAAIAQPALAQQDADAQGGAHADAHSQPPTAHDAEPVLHPAPVTTRNSVDIRNASDDLTTIHFEATVGTLTLHDENDERAPIADVFYIAYHKLVPAGMNDDGTPRFERPDPADRPITFSFNGGPGSSSVWLHLGVFGPFRPSYGDDVGSPGPPPYAAVPNEHSVFELSDFVFIDPVRTGFSRARPGVDEDRFHSVDGDIDSVADFIYRYLADHNRFGSPTFIAGESYGTTRAAGLTERLFSRHGLALNGVLLVSAVLDFQTIRFATNNDLPHMLFLPSYTATAHYHDRLDDELQERDLPDLLAEVERFALTDYAVALHQGAALPDAERDRIAARLARYTGLPEEFLLRADLRPSMAQFVKMLRRDEAIVVGRLDSRFTGSDRTPTGESSYEYDASYAAIQPNYTSALNQLLRTKLGYDTPLTYEILTGKVWPWDYSARASNRYLDVAEDLRSALHKSPQTKVYVASGYYDLATPYFATDYTIDHLSLDPKLRDNLMVRYYESGHMMYIHRDSLERQKANLRAFYAWALGDAERPADPDQR